VYGRWSVRHTNFAATLRQGGYYMRGGLIAKGGLICQIIRYEDTFVAIFNFGGGRCSDEAHRLYFWLALDVGFGWPADSWV
jgi:hypothetical protein